MTLFWVVGIPSGLFGQDLKIEPYSFVSKAKDTVQAELGTFNVLLDRDKGTNDSIQLSFVRFKSTNPDPKSPIVYLAGGPGGSGTATAKGKRFDLFMKLREISDVIAFDQRGTGMSENLPDCPYRLKFEPSKPMGKQEYVDRTSESIAKCLKFWEEENTDLLAYNTTESAKDLEDLRKVLQTDKISFWGISYGSHLAFEYIRLFENSIDKVVLASLEGPDETIKLPRETEGFVFKIAEKAKENYGSEVKYPNLREKIVAVHERLKKEPVTSFYKNRRGRIDTVGISNFELQLAVATFYLKNPDDSKNLPKVYNQMYAGNFSQIAPDVGVLKNYVLTTIRPMSFAMDMQSGISKERRTRVDGQIDRSILGSSINFLLYEWMTSLDLPQLPDDFREMKTNRVDALLLSGTMDGRTYLNDGIEIAKKFSNGLHVIIENGGHDLYMQSPVIGSMVLDFFKGKKPNIDRIALKPVKFE